MTYSNIKMSMYISYNLLDLPFELLLKIISYITHPKDISSLVKSSKYCQILARNGINKIDGFEYEQDSVLNNYKYILHSLDNQTIGVNQHNSFTFVRENIVKIPWYSWIYKYRYLKFTNYPFIIEKRSNLINILHGSSLLEHIFIILNRYTSLIDTINILINYSDNLKSFSVYSDDNYNRIIMKNGCLYLNFIDNINIIKLILTKWKIDSVTVILNDS